MYVCMRCDVCICVYEYLKKYGICTVRYLIKINEEITLGHLPVGPMHPLSMTGRPHAIVKLIIKIMFLLNK